MKPEMHKYLAIYRNVNGVISAVEKEGEMFTIAGRETGVTKDNKGQYVVADIATGRIICSKTDIRRAVLRAKDIILTPDMVKYFNSDLYKEHVNMFERAKVRSFKMVKEDVKLEEPAEKPAKKVSFKKLVPQEIEVF